MYDYSDTPMRNWNLVRVEMVKKGTSEKSVSFERVCSPIVAWISQLQRRTLRQSIRDRRNRTAFSGCVEDLQGVVCNSKTRGISQSVARRFSLWYNHPFNHSFLLISERFLPVFGSAFFELEQSTS